MKPGTIAPAVFKRCIEAIRGGALITRVGRDKEFHFQIWFEERLRELGVPYDLGGRNSYPDFRMVQSTDGFELKALAYPGRDVNFDSNSQAPSGFHNGRTIYYVFGRYPKEPDGESYPVRAARPGQLETPYCRNRRYRDRRNECLTCGSSKPTASPLSFFRGWPSARAGERKFTGR